MPSPVVTSFFNAPTNTVSYVIECPDSQICAVVDSVLDYDPASGRSSTKSAEAIVDLITKKELRLDWILETHAHADHLSAAPFIKSELGGSIAIGTHIVDVQTIFGELFNVGPEFKRDGSQFDHLFEDGDRFQIGELEARAIHTPGHTPACMTYIVNGAAFVGDTLFMPDYGTARADFPGGDAGTLFQSIQKLFSLPDETVLFLCHDYGAPGRDDFRWETTVGEQRRSNIHVHAGVTEAEFVAMRTARDKTLDMPTLILPSVQVNMRAGAFPPPEGNGQRYLKIPVDAI